MNQLGIYDILLTVMYFMLWVITFFAYHWKKKTFDAGSVLILFNIIYAAFSIHNIVDDEISLAYEPLSFFPFILLYVLLIVALAPNIYNHHHEVHTIAPPQTFALDGVAVILVLMAILRLPEILGNIQTGLVMLLVDSDAGSEAYEESLSNVIDSGKSVSNVPAIIFNMFSDIGVFLFFYYLSQKKYIWALLLSLPLVVAVLTPIMSGQRSGVAICMLTIITSFFLFKNFLSRVIVKTVYIIGSIFFALISLPVIAITMSRFGERSSGAFSFVSWYVGQANLYFNNYALDNGGIRYGDRTMYLVKKLLDPSTPANFEERRAKYSTLKIDDYYFSTFVGDFFLDFGPIIAILLILCFNIFVVYRLTRFRKADSIKVHQLLILFFSSCIYAQGGMYLFAYSDTGNFKIIAFLLLYLYLLYHDALLQRFPRKPYTIDE